MPKKGGDYISVLLTEDVLKIAEVKTGKTPRVTQVFTQSINGLHSPELPKFIQSGLKGCKAKGANIVCVVPSSMASTKNIEIPSTDEDEIRSIVSLQAGRHTPFSRDEIQIGYVNLGIFKANYTKVLLVIANRNKIKQQLDVLTRAGLKVSQVFFAPEAMAAFYSSALRIAGDLKPFAVIDIDTHQTDITIVSSGLPILSRSIPIGKVRLVSDVGGLVEELKQTLESYQNDDIGQVPGQFLMTRQDSLSGEVQKALQANLGWNVQTSDFLDHAKFSKNVVKRLSGQFSDVSFADVTAASVMAPSLQVNLLPEEIKIQKSVEDQGRQIFRAAVLGIVVLFFVGIGLGSQVFFKNVFHQRLVNNYRAVHDEAAVLMENQRRTQIIKNYMSDRMVSLDMLQELYQHIPQSIYLTSVGMEENGIVSVQGVSESGSEVYNFGSTLEGVSLFRKAQVKSTTARKDRGKDATAFEIAITLASAEVEVEAKSN